MADDVTSAESKLRESDLAGCLSDLKEEVRRNPADSKPRLFLAQLLMVLGDWERALTQLSVIAEMDASALPMTHAYRAAIQCEQLRGSVMRGERSPLVFGDPPPWIALLLQGLSALAAGRAAEAEELRVRAFDAAPPSAGSLNGVDFEWIADADSRLGPALEALLNGAYYWVPFERIAAIHIDPPEDLRDLVWLPAEFTWTNGGQTPGFIPTRYPGSEASQDAAIRLARKTEWSAIGADAFCGLGQRVLATSAEEVPLLQVRDVELRPAGP
jgi:type VI secretion system protein ImpE